MIIELCLAARDGGFVYVFSLAVVFYVLTPETTMISGDNRATASDLVFVGPEMCTHNFHIR